MSPNRKQLCRACGSKSYLTQYKSSIVLERRKINLPIQQKSMVLKKLSKSQFLTINIKQNLPHIFLFAHFFKSNQTIFRLSLRGSSLPKNPQKYHLKNIRDFLWCLRGIQSNESEGLGGPSSGLSPGPLAAKRGGLSTSAKSPVRLSFVITLTSLLPGPNTAGGPCLHSNTDRKESIAKTVNRIL